MKVIVYHTYYGCETGCCGHAVRLETEDDDWANQGFKFDHPYGEDHLAYAKEFVEKTFGKDHTYDLDWENCVISDD